MQYRKYNMEGDRFGDNQPSVNRNCTANCEAKLVYSRPKNTHRDQGKQYGQYGQQNDHGHTSHILLQSKRHWLKNWR